MGLAIPGNCDRTTILLTQLNDFLCKAQARRGEIGNDLLLTAILQQFRKVFVLIYIATTTKCKLECLAAAFVHNPLEILKRHIGYFGFESILVALHTRLIAESACAVYTMSHNTDIDQLRKGSHKRINTRILTILVQNTTTDIRTGVWVKLGEETVYRVIFDKHNNLHSYHVFRLKLVYFFTSYLCVFILGNELFRVSHHS